MDNSNSSAFLQNFQGIGSFQEMEASKYTGAASLTVFLYNHILTFWDEVDLIWSSPSSTPKFLFLMSRYMILPFLLLHAYDEGGFSGQILSDKCCKAYLTTSLYFGMISIGISNFLVLLRLWSTWDYNRRLVYRTATLFTLSQIGTAISASLFASHLIPEIAVLPYINSCALTKNIKFVQLWIPNLVFEAMVPVLVWLNVLSRPRKADSQITMELHRDGTIYVGTISIICITNVALSSFNSPTSLTFLIMKFVILPSSSVLNYIWNINTPFCTLSWSLSNIVLSHLVLNCRKVSTVVAADIAHAQGRNWNRINEEAPTGMRFMDGDFELSREEVWGWT